MHSHIMTATTNGNHNHSSGMENQQLIEASADDNEYSSSDDIFARDRFADQVGYGVL